MVVFNNGIINNGDFPLPGSTTKGNRRRGWIRTAPTSDDVSPFITINGNYIILYFTMKTSDHYNMIISYEYINHYYTVSHNEKHYDICITYFPIC